MSHGEGRACPILHSNWLRPIGVALLIAGLAHAVTITVPCSSSAGGASGLVAAINTANSTPGPNTINLTPGCVYTLTGPYQANNPNGLPPITGIITLNGYGATIARSQAAETPAFRILAVLNGGNLTLNVVRVRGGSVNNSGLLEGGFITGGGLSIEAGGKLTLNHSVVTENRADAFGGPECCGSGAGGGIYNLGIVTLNYSLVSKNVASSGSESGSAQGGGIYNRGALTLQCSTVTHNTASAGSLDTSSAGGGGIVSAGRLIMRHSLVSYNTVSAATDLDAEATAGGVEVAADSTAILAYSVIRNNTATALVGHTLALAGGLDIAGTATLYHVAIFGNTANSTGRADPNLPGVAAGGGLVIKENGKAKLLHTVVYGNSTHAPNGYALGGGINNGNRAVLAYSKVFNNTAEGETLANSLGGGIHNARYEGLYFGIGTVSGSLTLINSQIAGNQPDQCDPTGSAPGCSN